MKTKCQYPIGTQDGKTLFCDQTGVQRLGFCFCETHTGMAERGCLDTTYTSGETPRQIIERNREQLQRR